MRVRNKVTPPMPPTNQQQGRSGKAGANGSSQKMTLETLRRFQATQKGKRAGKFKKGSAVAEDEGEMTDFDTALVGAYERLDPDNQQQGQQSSPDDDEALEEAADKKDGADKKDQPLPKFLPTHARRI